MRVGPAVLWTMLVIVLLSLPGSLLPDSSLMEFDKLAHFGLFALGVMLWLRAARPSPAARMLVVVLSLAFAPASEWYQSMLGGGRTADPMDALADGLGVLAGVAAWYAWHRFFGSEVVGTQQSDDPYENRSNKQTG